MNQEAFDDLVEVVSGWWWSGPPDWVRILDSDRLRDLPNVAERRKWLRKAKAESLRRSIQERVDEIVEAQENDDDDPTSAVIESFTQYLKLYGDSLTPAQQRKWIKTAVVSAHGRSHEIKSLVSIIYFITFDNEYVKIGHTTNLKSRLRSLRTADRREPVILFTVQGSRKDEQELHRRFSSQLERREWFKLSGIVEEYIANQKA